jgi:hypothetical protein
VEPRRRDRWRLVAGRLLLPALAFAQLGGDCGPRGQRGAAGNVIFSFVHSVTPIVPLASEGTMVDLLAEARSSGGCGSSSAPYAQVVSTHPEVVTVTHDSGSEVTHLVTGMPGTSDIQLLTADGQVVDSLTLEVVPIANLRFETPMQPVRVLTGAPFTVTVSMVDARQRIIGGGFGRVQVVATAPLSTTHQDTFTGVEISGSIAGSGTGSITATSGGLQSSLGVSAAALADITSIAPETGDLAPMYHAPDQSEILWLIPSSAAGPVYGPTCTWTIPSGVKLESNIAASDLTFAAHNYSYFKLPAENDFPVTCTIGTATVTVTLGP